MEPFVYALLILTSVVGLAFIVERGIVLRWRRVVPPEIETAVESCQTPEDVPMLRRVCQQHNSPMSRLLLLAASICTGRKAKMPPPCRPAPAMKWREWSAVWSCWRLSLALRRCLDWSVRLPA